MHSLLVLVFGVWCVNALPFTAELDDAWTKYKIDYNKQYTLEDEFTRRLIWERNVRYIERHNKDYEARLQTFTVGLNKFADMSAEEFALQMNGLNISRVEFGTCHLYDNNVEIADLPDSVDWRSQGYVTPVKNQEQCGSCWAFSTTGSLEGQHFKKTGKLVSLSEKNLMDCSGREGNKGCEGGLMNDAFSYIIKNGGIDTEESYPYKPENGKCKYNPDNIGATMTSCKDIWKGSESMLQKAVAMEGPVSIGINAGMSSFQLYKSGVYYDELCSSHRIDHGVLAVGYGNYKGDDYWLVKNSWGDKWGMDGYIMMSRNKNNNCGIASQASFPVV
ncbi:hypothetical protein ACF0H5_006625 [Mactra antiquata]